MVQQMSAPAPITGLHHITLVAGNAQRTVDFYAGLLGLRLVKQTVNFDDPGSYHLYFGDDAATPGSLITFFEWPDAPRGRPGIGGTHHFALSVADTDGLLQWKRRLTDAGIHVTGPFDRRYFRSIYFTDPDGQVVEIATLGPGFTVDEAPADLGTNRLAPPDPEAAAPAAGTWDEPVPGITPAMRLGTGMHHVSMIVSDIARADAWYGDLLGLRRVKQTWNFDDARVAHWYWGLGDGRPGTLVTAFEWKHEGAARTRMGRGQTHHLALGVADDAAQAAWRARIVEAGIPVSPVRDRVYFRSIYTQDPDGHIIELATAGPGFAVDEGPEALGTGLQLPPWLASHRAQIEAGLVPLRLPETTHA